MSRASPQLKLRVPPELRDQIEHSAKTARRSMNAEVIIRLEASYAPKKSKQEEAL